MWQYANHVSKDFLKTNNPVQGEVKRWQAKLIEVYDFTRNALSEMLLFHLQRLYRENGISSDQILV